MASATTDPVCGMLVDREAAVAVEYVGDTYYFCESACSDTFRDDPDRWISPIPASEGHDPLSRARIPSAG